MSAFVLSIPALQENARILENVSKQSGAKIVLALKGFSCWHTFPFIKDFLDGCCASGLWEAKLAHQFFGKNILTYSPAYKEKEISELLKITTHLDFNSISQWNRFKNIAKQSKSNVTFGLRINPEYSTGHTPLYDPCAPGSRLGITAKQLKEADSLGQLNGISGLHFHTLCEQNSPDLEKTLQAVEENFAWLLSRPEITSLNMGGGHWITKPFYDRELLIKLIQKVKSRYNLEIWLEPGEALAIHTGVLRAEVLDVFSSNGKNFAILDVSTTAHMPDVLEMPYRPDIFLVDQAPSSQKPAVVFPKENYHLAKAQGENPYTYRIGSSTCLAGDVCGDFSFHRELQVGDILVFDDMAHYTMVKTTMFNGVIHPDIILQHADSSLELVRQFTYADFAGRLG